MPLIVSMLCAALQVFCLKLMEEANKGTFPVEVVKNIFSNISSIHTFHSQFLLPDLEKRMGEWWASAGMKCEWMQQSSESQHSAAFTFSLCTEPTLWSAGATTSGLTSPAFPLSLPAGRPHLASETSCRNSHPSSRCTQSTWRISTRPWSCWNSGLIVRLNSRPSFRRYRYRQPKSAPDKCIYHCISIFHLHKFAKNVESELILLFGSVKSGQSQEACGFLTLQHHMLEPVQRVPRYEMLLKDYLKKLPEDDSDRRDAESKSEMP